MGKLVVQLPTANVLRVVVWLLLRRRMLITGQEPTMRQLPETDQLTPVEEFRRHQDLLNRRSIITGPGELLNKVNHLTLRVTRQTTRGAVLTVLQVLITTAEATQIPVRLLAVPHGAVLLMVVVVAEQPGAVPLQVQVPMAEPGAEIN